jgi:Tfp pilus assembly protein PilN
MEGMERELLLLYIMAAFTGISAVALVIQMLFLFGVYRASKALQERSIAFMDRWEPLADASQKTLEQVRKQSEEILKKINDLADSSKAQMERADALITDITKTIRVQLVRVDHTVETSINKVNETVDALQKTILVPVRQVRALAVAASTVFEHLAGRRRPTVDQVTIDEELFI